MILIQTFKTTVDAYSAKALLENHGICFQLRDDLISRNYPLGKIGQFVDEKNATLTPVTCSQIAWVRITGIN
ncbi:hypothetical protein B1F79_02775 [Coxiella-like endosymbiont of Rhipicephalus sanguineus]|nr:hypothetical protein [Coxiella-like endosymbiont of Rhipicephalus sanguineus]